MQQWTLADPFERTLERLSMRRVAGSGITKVLEVWGKNMLFRQVRTNLEKKVSTSCEEKCLCFDGSSSNSLRARLARCQNGSPQAAWKPGRCSHGLVGGHKITQRGPGDDKVHEVVIHKDRMSLDLMMKNDGKYSCEGTRAPCILLSPSVLETS